MRSFKKLILLCFIFPLFASAQVAVVKQEGLYMEDKVKALEETLYKNQDGELSKDRYIKAMSLRANHYMKNNKNLPQALDDLRSGLFFLSKNPTSEKYREFKEKYDGVMNLMEYNPSPEDRLEVAKGLYLEGKYFASAYEFQELLNSNYENYIVSEYLGDIYQKLNNKKQAYYYYQKSIKYYNKNCDVYYKSGILDLDRGDRDSAFENMTMAIAFCDKREILDNIIDMYSKKTIEEPNNPNYFEILALSYQKLSDFSNAYENYTHALKLAGDDTSIQYHFAKFLQQSGNYSEAIAIYNKILSKNPYESQIRVERALCYYGLGQNKKALRELQGALILYPNFVQAQYEIYSLMAPDNIGDLPKLFYPLEKNPTLPIESYYKIGEYALSNKDITKSIPLFEYVISQDSKKADAYISLYKAYELGGYKDKGYELIKTAYQNIEGNSEIQKLYSDLNKDEITRQTSLAISYIKNNDYSNALKIYEQINPKDLNTYLSIANCYKVLKNPQAAIDTLKEAQKRFSDNSDVYYHLAALFSEQNSPQSAREYLKKSIELNKNNLKAYKLMAYIDNQEADKILDSCYDSFKNKDYKTTLEVLSKGIEKVPSASNLYYYRGMVYEETSDFESAAKDYRIVIKLNPDNLMGYYKLGKTLDVLGKEREAMEAYEKFLSGEPPMELIKEIQPRLDYLMKKYY